VTFADDSRRAVSWLWDFGGGFTSTDQNPGTGKFLPGRHRVTLTVTDADGDTDSAVVRFTVADPAEDQPDESPPAEE
jgi:PKD repeat protein